MKKPIRKIYCDTSVFGGVFDEEFKVTSEKLFNLIKIGLFNLVVSPLVDEEIHDEDTPQQVIEFYDKILPFTEAIKITKEAAEIGLVHMTDNTAEDSHILCACCECCCGNLAGLTRLDNPRAIVRANFVSKIDEDLCIACGTCKERCKFDAITVGEYAQVDPDACVGCGLCAVSCPESAIIMQYYERPLP